MTLYYKKKVKAHTRTINGKKIKVKGFFKKDNTLNKGLLSAGVGTLAGAGLLALPASRTLIKKGLKKGFKAVDKQYGKYNRNKLARILRERRNYERTGKASKSLERNRDWLESEGDRAELSIKDPLAAAYRDKQVLKQGIRDIEKLSPDGKVKQTVRKLMKDFELEQKRLNRKAAKIKSKKQEEK